MQCEPMFQQISFFAKIFLSFSADMQRQCSDGIIISFCVIAALGWANGDGTDTQSAYEKNHLSSTLKSLWPQSLECNRSLKNKSIGYILVLNDNIMPGNKRDTFYIQKQQSFHKSTDFCFICIVREPTSALINSSHIFNFVISPSYNIFTVTIASSKKNEMILWEYLPNDRCPLDQESLLYYFALEFF